MKKQELTGILDIFVPFTPIREKIMRKSKIRPHNTNIIAFSGNNSELKM
ncbi:MAG: hypothetical protein GWO20_19440 [Candidatus Korarchaeota archaeon]|nr:hypothetical protein [Candidatus Korarchaeota archaeon]NIU83652.1 hypothetical protein [Candidatus Thorarchaeota archaeon]NIW15528.1 hypothetical protein [Candidatus Thorarchaeota archaeon]NIW53473.1 hypothetical protein [Candidatus Korarchaeota archaeon]